MIKKEEKMNPTTPMRAIRCKCLSCTNGSSHEVMLCQIKHCPLWKYRSGHRPQEPKNNLHDES
jgi:hypothetical protein